jgi:signal peptidase II
MIFKFLSKNFYISFSIVALIYFLDRLSKIYVIQLDKNNLGSDIFNSTYLNIELIWNKGIAFGLLSFNESYLIQYYKFNNCDNHYRINYHVFKKPRF